MRSIAVVLFFVIVGLVTPRGAAASVVRAELDGHAIPVSAIPDLYCHDLDYPVILCFESADALESGLATALGSAPLTGEALPFVAIYQDIGLSGPYSLLAADYDNLSAIGWNDRISSFKSLNGYGGPFLTDAIHSGTFSAFSPGAPGTYVARCYKHRLRSVHPASIGV